MKKFLPNIILFFATIFIVSLHSCISDSRSIQELSVKTVEKKSKRFERKWIVYNNKVLNTKEEFEVYITKNNDSIFQQYKFFKSNVIDTARSKFYSLETKFDEENNIIKGRITVHSAFDYMVKNPVTHRTLRLSLAQFLADSVTMVQFDSKNQRYIDFEFKSSNDTITGFLQEVKQIDTMVNKEPMSRFVENYFPVDNKRFTDNFMVTLESKKN